MERHSLQIDGLACGYDGHAVVSDVSFSFETGATLCLLGPNGAGKTTLFKTLLGFMRPLAGSMRCDGVDMRTWTRHTYGCMFGYIPQTAGSMFNFTVMEMVLLGRTPNMRGLSHVTRRDRDIARRALETLGIYDLRACDSSQLSGGEFQMVLIARALAQQPAFLVMDEPTSSLDLGNQARVLEQVRDLANEGFGVIMTTHDPNQAYLLDGECICLADGGMALSGRSREALSAEVLGRIFGLSVGVMQARAADGRVQMGCMPFLEGGSR